MLKKPAFHKGTDVKNKRILGVLVPMSLFYIAVSPSTNCLFGTAIFVRRLHLLNKLVVNKDITHANKEKIISHPCSHKKDRRLFLSNYTEFKSNEHGDRIKREKNPE